MKEHSYSPGEVVTDAFVTCRGESDSRFSSLLRCSLSETAGMGINLIQITQ